MNFFDAESRPIPACYQSSMEAQESYHAACQAGFDGDYNAFLEMEAWHIRLDGYVTSISRGVQGLLEMDQTDLLCGIARQILKEQG